MDELSKQVAELKRLVENGQRRAFNVRVNGEEHSATSRAGIANILFPIDGQGMTFSECMFKLIFNDGEGSTPVVPGTSCGNYEKGTLLYPTLEDWKRRYPLGSAVDVDCTFGTTCWDYACAFWWGQVNRRLETGNQQAWGTLALMASVNAGTEFSIIREWTSIRPGDWAVWGNSGTGHIAMAMSCATADWQTINFWQQSGDGNDGGKPVFSSNIGKNLLGNTFKGAFRFNNWKVQPNCGILV